MIILNTYLKNEFKRYYITYLLIILNIIVFILMTIFGGSTNVKVLIFFGAKVNELIELGQYWRLISSIFIHIGFTHLLFNTYALLVLGNFAERIFGRFKFLLLYLSSGIGSSTASYLFSPHISAGASGAIFGLLGAIISFGWKNPFLWRSGLITNLLLVLAINLIFGMVVPGIDNYAHLGGLLTGALIGFLYKKLDNIHFFH